MRARTRVHTYLCMHMYMCTIMYTYVIFFYISILLPPNYLAKASYLPEGKVGTDFVQPILTGGREETGILDSSTALAKH